MTRALYTMCSNCAGIGPKTKHDPMACPLTSASYCSICASYGHTTMKCPDSSVITLRKPQFVEQLIPPSMLETYGITSRTPLANPTAERRPKHEPVLEVMESDKHIRAVLMNYSKQPSQKLKENKIRIQRLADELGRKLIFLTPVDEDKTSSKVAEPKKSKGKAPKDTPQLS